MKKIILALILIFSSLYSARLHYDLYKYGNGEGNTLLVLGGIHGNEPGGFFAPAAIVTNYKIKSGNLWVAPNLNFDSILKGRRGIYGDMNRKFDTIKVTDPDFEIIRDVKNLIVSKEVDLLLNLHDGHGFYRRTWQNSIFNPRAWGQTFIIDQKELNGHHIKFKDLDAIAKKASDNLNNGNLIKDYHTFRVKNTETKEKDEHMRLSLTYYAITHDKPAFAIETSKNIPNLTYKVQYQLKAIEEFMKIVGVEYERDFDLNNYKELKKIVYDFKYVVINDNIKLPLSNLRKTLKYMPLNHKNSYKFTHPLGAEYVNKDKSINLHIGHLIATKLKAQNFKLDKTLKDINIQIDGKDSSIKLPEVIQVKKSFKIKAPDGYRVNIIGFSKKGHKNENNLKVTKDKILKRYSIDNSGKIYRVEIYKDKKFCGMIVVEFI
jgi:hypothetical protein